MAPNYAMVFTMPCRAGSEPFHLFILTTPVDLTAQLLKLLWYPHPITPTKAECGEPVARVPEP